MRILHTGDWHMNAILGGKRIERSSDIIRSLEQIAAYLDERQVDVMIVAGDVFCDRSDPEALCSAVGEIKRIFTPFLIRKDRPGTILTISGNHDKHNFFQTLRHAMDLAPAVPTPEGILASGRLHLFHRPNLVKIADRVGTTVQFLLMPYPQEYWLKDLEYDTRAGQHRAKQDRFTKYLELLRAKSDQALPSVLVSHILIQGAKGQGDYRFGIEQDVVFSRTDIPTEFEYIAYGHIHQAQTPVANAPWIRYCGSVERLDGGDRNDEKTVAVVDIGPNGRIDDPEVLPLPFSPMARYNMANLTNPNVLSPNWSENG